MCSQTNAIINQSKCHSLKAEKTEPNHILLWNDMKRKKNLKVQITNYKKEGVTHVNPTHETNSILFIFFI